jgi:hypothetical protein
MIDPELERAVLRLVRDGRGRASWHSLATRLPSFPVPLVPDVMTVLKDLLVRGLVSRVLRDGGMDAWAITAAGHAYLDGQLDAGALARFLAALRADAVTATRAVLPFVDDGPRMRAVLRQALGADATAAEAVARVALFLPQDERGPFARELLDDARSAVRAALFRAWSPVRSDVPGNALPTVSDAELDGLLRRGLTDPSPDVREAAAMLTFLAARGEQLVGELTANARAPERHLRWWSILALGRATDPGSLVLLSELVVGPDLAFAAAAVRALGARRDGHGVWLSGLHDPRPDVRDAAIFALRTVVTDLTERDLAAIAGDRRPAVRAAFAVYQARVSAGR